jgi:hypothetical protein
MVLSLYLFYELVDYVGVISYMRKKGTYMVESYKEVKEYISETHEEMHAWIFWVEGWFSLMITIMPMKKWFVVCIVLALLCYSLLKIDETESTASASQKSSSTGGSQGGTPDSGNKELGSLMVQQIDFMKDLCESQRAMKEEVADVRTAQRAFELRREAMGSSGGATGSASTEDDKHRKALEAMAERMKGFEDLLRGKEPASPDQAGRRPEATSPVAMRRSSSAEATLAIQDLETTPGTKRAMGETPLEIQSAIKKLKNKSMLPQQVFLKQLEAYAEVDLEAWHHHFPEGFRTRISGEVLAEIYSTGFTGEQYGRNFLRDRELLECHQAREIIAVLSALDAMMLVDKQEGMLNLVSTERLCRKAHGLMKAYDKVKCLADWQKPKAAGQNWKPKTCWEEARRIDPALRMMDTSVSIPKAEEEIRKAMERDASILKAKSKLEERGGNWDGT